MSHGLDVWWPAFFAQLPENLPQFVGVAADGSHPMGASRGHIRLGFDEYWKAWLWRSRMEPDMRVMCEAWLLLFDAFLEELSAAEWPRSTQQLTKLQGLAKKIEDAMDRLSPYCGSLGFWQVVLAAAIDPVDKFCK
jgi:hypothetical protein